MDVRVKFVVFFFCLGFSNAWAASGFEVEDVAGGFDKPTDMAFVPGAGILISERCGAVKYVSDAGDVSEVATIAKVDCKSKWRGLLAIAIDPAADDNDYLYAIYSQNKNKFQYVVRVPYSRKGENVSVDVSKVKILMDDLPDFKQNSDQNASGLAIGPEGHLFIGVGDDDDGLNASTLSRPQDLTQLHGKLLRIKASGGVPSGNPKFAGAPSKARGEIYAIGMNSPNSLGIDSDSGQIWIGDVAINEANSTTWIQEVNLAEGGENFGWPGFAGEKKHKEVKLSAPDPTVPRLHYESKGGQGSVVVGRPYRVTDGKYAHPNWFQGAVPVADFWQTWIKLLVPEGDGFQVQTFEPGPVNVVAIDVREDGAFYVLSGGQKKLSRMYWNDKPPSVSIVSPEKTYRYGAGETLKLEGTGDDPEEGSLTKGFKWVVSLFDAEGKNIDTTELEGKTAEYKLPVDADIKGKLTIRLEVRDSVGGLGEAEIELIPESILVTFGTDPAGVAMTVDGTEYSEATASPYSSGTEVSVWCPFEMHLPLPDADEPKLHVFFEWSDGEKCAQMMCGTTPCCRRTFVVPDKDVELLCKYLPHGVKIPAADETAIIGEYVPPDEGITERTGGSSGGCAVTTGESSPAQPLLLLSLLLTLLIKRVRRSSLH